MKVKELIAANDKWSDGALITVRAGVKDYGRMCIATLYDLFGDMYVWGFGSYGVLISNEYPSLFTFDDLYKRSLEIDPSTVLTITCCGMQGELLAKEAVEKFGKYTVKRFYETDIVLGGRIGGTLKEWIFNPQVIDAAPPIVVDGVETSVRLGVWAKELYGNCYVDYVDTEEICVVNGDVNVHDFIMQCANFFGSRKEFMKKVLNCFYARVYEADLHFCLGFLYAENEYDMAVKLLNLVRRYRGENN